MSTPTRGVTLCGVQVFLGVRGGVNNQTNEGNEYQPDPSMPGRTYQQTPLGKSPSGAEWRD